ncbi:MAG: hypothetical protein ACYCO9_08850 [Streptosporangiaceae bacterium]
MDYSTREADAAFADLICDDPQWLDAEFGALIAAAFGGPPAEPPPSPPWVPPQPGAPRRLSLRSVTSPASNASPPAGPGHRRQRSPPARLPG